MASSLFSQLTDANLTCLSSAAHSSKHRFSHGRAVLRRLRPMLACTENSQVFLAAPAQADSATVLRDRRLAVVPAAQLVPGDIVEVAVGGNVPADLRVAERLSTTLRYAAATVTFQSKASQPLRLFKHVRRVAGLQACRCYSRTLGADTLLSGVASR